MIKKEQVFDLSFLIEKCVERINNDVMLNLAIGKSFINIEYSWRLRNTEYIILGSGEFQVESKKEYTIERLTKSLIGKKIIIPKL